MELNRDAEGGLSPLKSKNIDTGLGLERMAQILQGVPNNYETDLLRPLLDLAGSLAGIAYETANDAQQRDLKVGSLVMKLFFHLSFLKKGQGKPSSIPVVHPLFECVKLLNLNRI